MPGTTNSADASTKAQVGRLHPLVTLMETKTINAEPVDLAELQPSNEKEKRLDVSIFQAVLTCEKYTKGANEST